MNLQNSATCSTVLTGLLNLMADVIKTSNIKKQTFSAQLAELIV